MCAEKKLPSATNLTWSIITNRCPRCRRGKLFANPNPYDLRTTMRMHEHCPVCGLKYERETGFFFGTGYVSYGLSVGVIAAVFAAWQVLIGISPKDNSIFLCLGLSALLLILTQPLLQRLSRSIWIAIFVRYERNAVPAAR